MQVMHSDSEILRRNKALPDDLKQCSVVILFTKPKPRHTIEHFYRIRMTQGMKGSGEEGFFKPELLQPGRVGKQKCLGCMRWMKRVGSMSTACTNSVCDYQGRTVVNGPLRGVQSVKVEFEVKNTKTGVSQDISFLVGAENCTIEEDVWLSIGIQKLGKKGFKFPDTPAPEQVILAIKNYLGWDYCKMPVDITSGCLLVLDRRYSDQCLCAVYRTAGMVCDQEGWLMK